MSASIECQDISLEIIRQNNRPVTVLDDISTTFGTGSMTLISGVTGAGKTSLLHILAGLMRPTSGQVVVDGQPVSRWVDTHRSRWRRRVGIVFQHHHLFNDLTTLENVLVPIVPCISNMRELRRKGRQALASVSLTSMAAEKIHTLSGGERQRVNLARALVNKPDFLFADEPTAHQDDDSAAAIMRLLTEARDNAVTIIIAAHDPRVGASGEIDERYRLEEGKLEDFGF